MAASAPSVQLQKECVGSLLQLESPDRGQAPHDKASDYWKRPGSKLRALLHAGAQAVQDAGVGLQARAADVAVLQQR